MTVNLLVGDLLTGQITATVEPTALRWTDTLNSSGSIEGVTLPLSVVRDHDLRGKTNGVRSFIAVEVDGRIKQAGPIWSRTWNWEQQQATVSAAGVWSWLDRCFVRPAVLTPPIQSNVFTVSGKSLGGIARALVERATLYDYASVPIVLPPDEAGTHTESFPVWSLLRYGEQLRQITQRATDAPDIAFTPRRRQDDPRFIEWVMRVGTAEAPALQQVGPEWVFDTSAPRSPVLGISTDEDATGMAQQIFVTGNGQEEAILFAAADDNTLIDLGWPITEASASFHTVEEQATLDGHAASELERSNRPIESFKVAVHRSAAAEVLPGDYARIVTRGDVWLGDLNRSMRVRSVSGDLSDVVTLEMFPVEAIL